MLVERYLDERSLISAEEAMDGLIFFERFLGAVLRSEASLAGKRGRVVAHRATLEFGGGRYDVQSRTRIL